MLLGVQPAAGEKMGVFQPAAGENFFGVFFLKEILNNKNTPKFIERFFEIIRTHLYLLELEKT